MLRIKSPNARAFPKKCSSGLVRFYGLELRVERAKQSLCIVCHESATSVESRSECLRPVVYSSLIRCTSCIVKSFRSRSSFISSPLWTP